MQKVIDKYPNALSNFDIEKLAKKLKIKHFRGVFMIDELPIKPQIAECGIVNLDTSDHAGTHWICYYKNNDDKFVFDSFGGNIPKQLVKYMGKDNLYYNNQRIQNFNEVVCGHLCIFMLKLLSDGYEFSYILNLINGHFWK